MTIEAEAAGAPLREALERLRHLRTLKAAGEITQYGLGALEALERVEQALAATPAPAPLDVEAGLAVLDNLKEKAFAYWSEESLKHDYAFHPNVFWAWLDEERARLTARAAATDCPVCHGAVVGEHYHRDTADGEEVVRAATAEDTE